MSKSIILSKRVLGLLIMMSATGVCCAFNFREGIDVVETIGSNDYRYLTLIISIVFVVLLLIGISFSALKNYFQDSPNIKRNKKEIARAIASKKLYQIGKDIEVYPYRGTIKDKKLKLSKGELCKIIASANQANIVGIKMQNDEKYRRPLAINFDDLVKHV